MQQHSQSHGRAYIYTCSMCTCSSGNGKIRVWHILILVKGCTTLARHDLCRVHLARSSVLDTSTQASLDANNNSSIRANAWD